MSSVSPSSETITRESYPPFPLHSNQQQDQYYAERRRLNAIMNGDSYAEYKRNENISNIIDNYIDSVAYECEVVSPLTGTLMCIFPCYYFCSKTRQIVNMQSENPQSENDVKY